MGFASYSADLSGRSGGGDLEMCIRDSFSADRGDDSDLVQQEEVNNSEKKGG